MLLPGWRQAVEERTQHVLWDLCYNPQRWRSWIWLCNEYKQALEVSFNKQRSPNKQVMQLRLMRRCFL
jgi:hypothetical protein